MRPLILLKTYLHTSYLNRFSSHLIGEENSEIDSGKRNKKERGGKSSTKWEITKYCIATEKLLRASPPSRVGRGRGDHLVDPTSSTYPPPTHHCLLAPVPRCTPFFFFLPSGAFPFVLFFSFPRDGAGNTRPFLAPVSPRFSIRRTQRSHTDTNGTASISVEPSLSLASRGLREKGTANTHARTYAHEIMHARPLMMTTRKRAPKNSLQSTEARHSPLRLQVVHRDHFPTYQTTVPSAWKAPGERFRITRCMCVCTCSGLFSLR